MSFKTRFATLAALFSAGPNNEIVAEEGFSKVEMTGEQLEVMENEIKTLGEAKAKTEADLKAATEELVAVYAGLEAAKAEAKANADKVVALEADVKAKDEKLAEFSKIAAGEATVSKTNGEKADDNSAEPVLKYTAEYAEKHLGLI